MNATTEQYDVSASAQSESESQTLATTPMPLLPITSQQTIELCASLPLCPNDIFICSYPKSGTTWTQHIVLSLLIKSQSKNMTESDAAKLEYNHVSDYSPFYEVDQHWDAESKDLIESVRRNHDGLGRRVFNTHLRWDMLPRNMEGGGKSKFIYLIRSPMDVCLSFYCHLSNQEEGGYEGDFELFFSEWIEGKIAFGSYIDHILSFAPAFVDAGEGREVLLISYEEMLSDLSTVVAKIAKFIDADVTEEDLKELLPTFTFQHMKSDLNRFQPRSVTWKNGFKFLRRVVSGDSLHVATSTQRDLLKAWMEKEEFVPKLSSVLSGTNPDTFKKIVKVCCNS